MKSVRSIKNLEGVPVLLRTSLNAPVEAGTVTDAFRLNSAIPTIAFLQSKHAKTILLSHISGTGSETLRPMFEALKDKVRNLSFCDHVVGPVARDAIRAMVPGDVLMLENLRRHQGEEKNDPEFARELASLADMFVQDSFDVCHRTHASVVGIPELLPSYAGFTLEKEVVELRKALKPRRPSLAVIGGAKFSTKEPLLKQLLRSYDHIFVGGALANDFIQAKGYAVGVSLVSSERQEEMKMLMKNRKVIVPVDAIVAPHNGMKGEERAVGLKEIQEHDSIVDIGPHTAAALAELAHKAKTILWSGPLGFFEHGFIGGTRVLAEAAIGGAYSVVGGGDTIAALDQLGVTNQFSFVSTGGGAMLDFLVDGTLPGIDVLR